MLTCNGLELYLNATWLRCSSSFSVLRIMREPGSSPRFQSAVVLAPRAVSHNCRNIGVLPRAPIPWKQMSADKNRAASFAATLGVINTVLICRGMGHCSLAQPLNASGWPHLKACTHKLPHATLSRWRPAAVCAACRAMRFVSWPMYGSHVAWDASTCC